MRLIYVSYDLDGYLCLKEILRMGGIVVAIFTLTDDLLKQMVNYRAFDDIAVEHNIPLYKVRKIADPDNIAIMKNLRPDYIFVLGWSQIITKEILAIPTKGAIGVHPTLLPRNRGRAPITWAIIKGLKKSGVTLFFLDEGADSGDIIAQKQFEIGFKDGADTVSRKISQLQVELVREAFPLLMKDRIVRIPQDHTKANYWPRRRPEDGIIDWHKSSRQLYNWVRGLTHPYPGAFTYHNGTKLFIWEARLSAGATEGTPGEILAIRDDGMTVATGKGRLLVTRVQFEGGPESTASKAQLTTHGVHVGDILGKAERR